MHKSLVNFLQNIFARPFVLAKLLRILGRGTGVHQSSAILNSQSKNLGSNEKGRTVSWFIAFGRRKRFILQKEFLNPSTKGRVFERISASKTERRTLSLQIVLVFRTVKRFTIQWQRFKAENVFTVPVKKTRRSRIFFLDTHKLGLQRRNFIFSCQCPSLF